MESLSQSKFFFILMELLDDIIQEIIHLNGNQYYKMEES